MKCCSSVFIILLLSFFLVMLLLLTGCGCGCDQSNSTMKITGKIAGIQPLEYKEFNAYFTTFYVIKDGEDHFFRLGGKTELFAVGDKVEITFDNKKDILVVDGVMVWDNDSIRIITAKIKMILEIKKLS